MCLGHKTAVVIETNLDGVSSAEGQDWSRQRDLINQAFSSSNLRRLFPPCTPSPSNQRISEYGSNAVSRYRTSPRRWGETPLIHLGS